jgi:hypothetical protein
MGATRRRLTYWLGITVLPAILWLPGHAGSAEREVAGMITEIHVGRGQVEVRSADSGRWRPATPLLTLRDGDTVEATRDAWVVIVLTGGRGSVRVDDATAPFIVNAFPMDRGPLSKGLKILEASFDFLSTTKELPLGVLGTRGGMKPPAILTPHNGLVLPDSLVFEWRGSPSSRMTVRVAGPTGLVFERPNHEGTRFRYPSDAPALAPAVRYRFQLLAARMPAQEVWFEVVDPTDAEAIRRELSEMEAALGPDVNPATLVILRAGVLASHGLLHDARLGLIEELVREPDEPTLHYLLGDLYARQGLSEEATESFAEARFLMRGGTAP